MSFLPNDPDAALGACVAIVRSEQRRFSVWAGLSGRQGRHIKAVIRADQNGELTKDDIVVRLHEIAHEAG